MANITQKKHLIFYAIMLKHLCNIIKNIYILLFFIFNRYIIIKL